MQKWKELDTKDTQGDRVVRMVRWMNECNKPSFKPSHESILNRRGSLVHTPTSVRAHIYTIIQTHTQTNYDQQLCLPVRNDLLL